MPDGVGKSFSGGNFYGKFTSIYTCPNCRRTWRGEPAQKKLCPFCKATMVETKKGVIVK